MKQSLDLGPSFETKIQAYLAIIWQVANRASQEGSVANILETTIGSCFVVK